MSGFLQTKKKQFNNNKMEEIEYKLSDIGPVMCYNETQKLEFAYVMFQQMANECYALQQDQVRFNRKKLISEKHLKGAVNRADKKKASKNIDIEMKFFDNEVRKFMKNTNYMCESVEEQIPVAVERLMDLAIAFMNEKLLIKS